MEFSDNPDKKIVGVDMADCPNGPSKHAQRVAVEGGGLLLSEDVIHLMDLGTRFFMIPPPGAPAYEAHLQTGLPLLLQTRTCPDCGKRVIFA